MEVFRVQRLGVLSAYGGSGFGRLEVEGFGAWESLTSTNPLHKLRFSV